MKIDVKAVVAGWKEESRGKVQDAITLRIIQVGDNAASNKYVAGKLKDAKELGIYTDYVRLPDIDRLFEVIDESNESEAVTGVIVQLPIVDERFTKEELKKIEEDVALAISPEKDVDGFHPMSPYVPATALGVMRIIDAVYPDGIAGKNALVIGRSKLVGLPTAKELLKKDATVEIAHSKSKNLEDKLLKKDIVVCAVGKPGFLDRAKCGPGALVIDVGTNMVEGKLVGDTKWGEEKEDWTVYTPVPGGVGLTTRMGLMANVIEAAARKKEKEDRNWVNGLLGL